MNDRLKYRLAVVNSHPIQYFAPLYAYLNRDPDLEITVLYCSDFSLRGGYDPGFKHRVTWDVDLLNGYKSKFLGTRAKRRQPAGFLSLICPQIWHEIRHSGYDAVWLHGYSFAAYILAFIAAKTSGVFVFIRSETHLGLKRRTWRRKLRDTILKVAYRYVYGFLAIGTANQNYYRSLGIPDEKIFSVPYAVDNERFIVASGKAALNRDEIRQKYGLRLDQPVVLFASKFIRRKRPDDLVSALSILRQEGMQVTLFMVGTGEMEPEIRGQIERFSLVDVVFSGFVNQKELPQVYAASDVFVLPSESEPWGLIVNEVMCAGLPVVVSDEVGCVPDLVMDGVNGFRFQTGNVRSLAEAIKNVISNESRRKVMGSASLKLINNWSFVQCRQGLRSALVQIRRKS